MRILSVFDLETTGTDVTKDRPTQVGLLQDGRVFMNSLCDPLMPIEAGASEVTGIYSKDVVGHPDFIAALWTLFQLLPPPGETIICGFNSSMFDAPMVDHCMAGTGLQIASKYDQIDVLDLLYRYEPGLKSRKLAAVYEHFTGIPLAGAHGAIADCIGTYHILLHLMEAYEKTAEEFVAELTIPQVYQVMPIGKHAGMLIEQVPISWARWMHNNAKDMRPDLQCSIDWILGKK